MPSLKSCFAQNLVALRKARGLTQDALAKAIGVTRGTIANYETGVGGITVDIVARIAKELGIEETDLFDVTPAGLTDAAKSADAITSASIEALRKASLAFTQEHIRQVRLAALDSQAQELSLDDLELLRAFRVLNEDQKRDLIDAARAMAQDLDLAGSVAPKRPKRSG